MVITASNKGVSFGEHVRRRVVAEMDRRGWNQSRLARESGIQGPQLSRLLSDQTGKFHWLDSNIDRLAVAFGIDPVEFICPTVGVNKDLPENLQRIISCYQSSETYRVLLEYQEQEIFEGCVRRGLIK